MSLNAAKAFSLPIPQHPFPLYLPNPGCATAFVVIFVTARKRSLGTLCFHRCFSVHKGGGSLSGGRGSVQGGLCVGSLYPGVSLSRGILSKGVSVWGGLCPGGLCPRESLSGGSLSRGVLSRGVCPGVSVQGSLSGRPIRKVTCRQYAS